MVPVKRRLDEVLVEHVVLRGPLHGDDGSL